MGVFLTFALAGFIFIFHLPISIFPHTDFLHIIILINSNIVPFDLRMLTVTREIEESIRIVPCKTNVCLVASRGLSEITVYFRWDEDILHAVHLGQGRIAQIAPNVPPAVRSCINRLRLSAFPMIGFRHYILHQDDN